MRNLIIPLLLILFFGCASVKEIPTLKPAEKNIFELNEIISNINIASSSVKTLKAEGIIELEIDSIVLSPAFTLMLKNPDSVKISLEGPFGINIGEAILTDNSFLFYNKLQNIVLEGSIDFEKTPIPIPKSVIGKNFISLFSGLRNLPSNCQNKIKQINQNEIVVECIFENIISEFYIDRSIGKISKVNHYQKDVLLLTEKYFHKNPDLAHPTEIVLEIPAKKRSLKIYFEEVNYNVQLPEFKIEIDNSAKRKVL